VPIDFLKMVLEILNMVIVPVVSGLIANRILYGTRPWAARAGVLAAISVGAILLALSIARLPAGLLHAFAAVQTGAVVGLALIGFVAFAKLVVNVVLRRPNTWMDRTLPLVSMIGICFIIAIITARSRDKLLTVGPALIGAAILHNAIGYTMGYWLSRLIRLDQTTCRTIAIEVGMQNGGMASGLAMGVLKSADAALAPAIFGPWMNISGSILASWWRKRPVTPVRVPLAETPPPSRVTNLRL
jgi:bile acid:Na+ symporter, BASS family